MRTSLLTRSFFVSGSADLVEHPNAIRVAAALKLGVKPRFHDQLCELDADDARAEGEHVRVVVLSRKSGGIGLAAHHGADASYAVGGEGNADSRAADGDAAVGTSLCDCARNTFAVDGIITALRRVGAEIQHLMPERNEICGDLVLHFHRDVVVSDCNLH